MDLAYYYDENNKTLPFNDYLKESISSSSNLSRDKKGRLKASINEKIVRLKKRNGKTDGNKYKTIRGYDFFEICQKKDKDTLIRILYCCHDGLLVLIDAFEKPRNYSDKRTKEKIKRYLDNTQVYYEDLKENNNYYIV